MKGYAIGPAALGGAGANVTIHNSSAADDSWVASAAQASSETSRQQTLATLAASLQTRTQNNFRTPRSMTNEGNGQGRSERGAPGPRRTGQLTRFGEVVAQVRGVLTERVIVSPALGHD